MISTIRWIVNRRLGFCAGRFVAEAETAIYDPADR
jgi:hypothetical protein